MKDAAVCRKNEEYVADMDGGFEGMTENCRFAGKIRNGRFSGKMKNVVDISLKSD